MSSQRIVHSASHATALRWAAAHLGNSETLVIAPTRAAADELVRTAAATGFTGLHRMTLTQLAAGLAVRPMAERGLAPVSQLGIEALAARVVHTLRRDGKLHYFHPVADMPGFARALAATVTELRLEDVDLADLARSGAPGEDLARLARSYAEELVERSLADLSLLMGLAADVARKGSHRFVGLPAVLAGVRIETAAHHRLVAALAAKAPAVFATALTADTENIEALEEILGVRAEALEEESSLRQLRANLFSIEPAAAALPEGSFEFFSAPGEGLECVEIARRLRLLAAQGIAFDHTAILLRNPERYQPLVEEALRRAGIPGYFNRGSARPDPAGRAFLALLACASEGCSASRFAEYLSLGQVPPLDASGAPAKTPPPWIAPDDEVLAGLHNAEPEPAEESADDQALKAPFGWEKFLIDAAVIGGRERWARRLKGLESEFKLQLAQRDLDEPHREHIARQLARLGNLERFALPLIDELAALPRSALWGEWLERLSELAALALRRPESVLSVLNELQPMSEVGPVELDEVAGVLSERLRFLRREPPLRRYGRVFVGTIDEARSRVFDVVFLPGLAEGLFPRRAFEDPLLLDDYRKKINTGRNACATQDDRVARERLLLRTAAAAAGARFVASYPRMDTAQARARVPSFYSMELARAAEGKLPALRDFEQRALKAAPARLGWPAPREPREAIDDAEYDLAWLDGALRESAQGGARYLMLVNPHLGRSLRTRWKRWSSEWSTADGLVGAAGVLAPHRLSERPYSPTALQQYAVCPYRFLLSAIHLLRPRQEMAPLEQMDPLTRGALFHAAQFEFFQELERTALPGAEPDRTQQILDLADRVLERVAAKFEDDLAPAIPRVWKTEVEDLRRDLRGWLQHMPRDWKPVHCEYGFGLESDAEDVNVEGVRLRGSIDLVEEHRSTGGLRVTDHKTGKPPSPPPRSVGGGEILQPLLYALAAEKLLSRPIVSGRLFYCTERGNYLEFEIPLGDQSREQIRRVNAIVGQAIEQGFLPAAPRKDACSLCDYKLVCGPYEETRVARKNRARLEPLAELRGMP